MVTGAKGPAAQLHLPPGFRFHPTDEELVLHYLGPKAEAYVFSLPVIADVDLYKHDPWDLPGMYPPDKAIFGEREWYFFSPRDRKYPNGARPNRAAGSGYWKATGTDKPIYRTKDVKTPAKIGVKKALVFYKGRAPKGVKTNWIMHEYRLAENGISPTHHVHRKGSLRLDDWVLCRIYKKSTNAQRVGKERESSSCVEEVLASLPEIDNPRTIMLPRLEQTLSGIMDQDLHSIHNMSSPGLIDSFLTGEGSDGGSPSHHQAAASSPPADAGGLVQQHQAGGASSSTGFQPKMEHMPHPKLNGENHQHHHHNHNQPLLNRAALLTELGVTTNGCSNPMGGNPSGTGGLNVPQGWRPTMTKELMAMMSAEMFMQDQLRHTSPPELLDMEDEAQSSYRASLANVLSTTSGGTQQPPGSFHHQHNVNSQSSSSSGGGMVTAGCSTPPVTSFGPSSGSSYPLDMSQRSNHNDDGTLGSIHAHFARGNINNSLGLGVRGNTMSNSPVNYIPGLTPYQQNPLNQPLAAGRSSSNQSTAAAGGQIDQVSVTVIQFHSEQFHPNKKTLERRRLSTLHPENPTCVGIEEILWREEEGKQKTVRKEEGEMDDGDE
ncbi:hypothetical protein R1sor_004959 [Riccia sorocarpa]|uniref:NAC domain-containing protein n=1 Tax=Riccia sorocarpa TaxID=122646 RepID=A0ABD3HI53_9MARC